MSTLEHLVWRLTECMPFWIDRTMQRILQKGVIRSLPTFSQGKDSVGNNSGRNIEAAAVNTREKQYSYTLLPDTPVYDSVQPFPLVRVSFLSKAAISDNHPPTGPDAFGRSGGKRRASVICPWGLCGSRPPLRKLMPANSPQPCPQNTPLPLSPRYHTTL